MTRSAIRHNRRIFIIPILIYLAAGLSSVGSAERLDRNGSREPVQLQTGLKQMSTKGTSPASNRIFPSLQHNDVFSTGIGIVNVGTFTAAVTISYYTASGEEAIPATVVELDPMERYYADVGDEPVPDVAWAMATSDGALAGYVNTMSRDGNKSMFVRASRAGEIILYVPHIAPEVDFWNTNSALVNASDSQDANVFFDYVADSAAMPGPVKPNSQYAFEWVDDFFEGTFPEDMPFWGTVWNLEGASLAGMESFSRKGEGVYQLCGLDLKPDTATVLYFPHIHVDGGYWWTGLAIENVTGAPAQVTFTPYDAGGAELESVVYEVGAYEKLVNVAQAFWTDKSVDFPESTAWIKVETDGGRLIGYELFGTLGDAGNRLLAGIHAPSQGYSSLLYPHVESSEDFWTGVVALNVGTEAGTLTATAYDGAGKELVTEIVEPSLSPNQKLVTVVRELFTEELPGTTEMVLLSCDQPITGFELWGDLNPQNHISGMLAEPMPPLAYREGFENIIPLQYPSGGSSEDWMIVQMPDDADGEWGWDHASLIGFDDGSYYIERWPQVAPHGYDYLVGFYGLQQGASYLRNHELIVSPVIDLPDSTTTLSFYSQFGWASYYGNADTLYITEDTVVSGPSILDNAQVLYQPTAGEVGSLPLSAEPGVAADGFTHWYPVQIDVSAYAGKTVRFVFEVDTVFEEAWHIDEIQIR